MFERFAGDDRAQSFTYLIAAATIIIGAAIVTVFDQPVTDMTNYASDQCITANCTTGVSNVQTAWTWFPFVVVGMVLMMIIAASVFQSRRP